MPLLFILLIPMFWPSQHPLLVVLVIIFEDEEEFDAKSLFPSRLPQALFSPKLPGLLLEKDVAPEVVTDEAVTSGTGSCKSSGQPLLGCLPVLTSIGGVALCCRGKNCSWLYYRVLS